MQLITIKLIALAICLVVAFSQDPADCQDWKPIIKEICADPNRIVFENSLPSYCRKVQESVNCIISTRDQTRWRQYVDELNSIKSYCATLSPAIVKILKESVTTINMLWASQHGVDMSSFYTSNNPSLMMDAGISGIGSVGLASLIERNDFTNIPVVSKSDGTNSNQSSNNPRVAGQSTNPTLQFQFQHQELQGIPDSVLVNGQPIKISRN